MSDEADGVVFPEDAKGSRSTTAVGRAVVAAALAGVDPVGAKSAAAETNWRSGYTVHLRRAVEAGLDSRPAAVDIAARGLGALQDRLAWRKDGTETALAHVALGGSGTPSRTVAGVGSRETEVSLPWQGDRLTGSALLGLLDRWDTEGIVEPSVGEAVRAVIDHPEWLRLEGFRVAVLGAGAEMGPLRSLLRWGATVAAIDLPSPAVWSRVTGWAQESAGTMVMPVDADSGEPGLDLGSQLPEVAGWLSAQPDRLVMGNYVYADGAANLRLSAAVDALTVHLTRERPDTALAFLATPTDVFGVPADAVAQASRHYDERSSFAKLTGRPLRALSAGRLLRRNYLPDADPGVNDSVVPQQGPNYLLAKRVHRWRAAVARDSGGLVSMNVAPPTRTRSVIKNRALAAAYAGAHRFGVEVFDPATSNTLMAILLVHDLETGGGPDLANVWADEAWSAVHGGLWRAAYAPRSALGLAALMGYGASRG